MVVEGMEVVIIVVVDGSSAGWQYKKNRTIMDWAD
jgi:hypothetical protein